MRRGRRRLRLNDARKARFSDSFPYRRGLGLSRDPGSVALPLLHEPLHGIMHRRQSVDETVVGGEAPLIHGDDVAVKGIEPLCCARLAGSRFAHEAGRLLRGLARRQFNLRRRLLDARDQTLQLALDRADAGGVLLNAAKLLADIGDLPLDVLQILELGRLGESSLEARGDLLHARIQPVDRRGRHRLANRALEPLRHFDQSPVEIGIALAGRRKLEGWTSVARFVPGQERGALGVGERSLRR